MKIRKFNEDIDDQVDISNVRVGEITDEMVVVMQSIDDTQRSVSELTMELSKYRSKSTKSNDQIDDASINLELLGAKLNESLEIIGKINGQLSNYVEDGRKFLY